MTLDHYPKSTSLPVEETFGESHVMNLARLFEGPEGTENKLETRVDGDCTSTIQLRFDLERFLA